MTMIRNYIETNQILVFDEKLDQELSTYDATHLEKLAIAEPSHFWFQTRREKICDIFSSFVKKEARILEVGGGTGFIATELQKRGFDVEMSDVASNGLQYAREKGIKKLYQFDLFNPPFQEAFDVICLFDVLEHLNEDGQAIQALKKMLKPGGLIILTVPAHRWLWNHDDVLAGHKRRYTKTELKNLFRASGLTPLLLQYFFIFIVPFLLLRTTTKKKEIDFSINPLLNKFFHGLTSLEFKLEKLFPNILGGSLIGIGRKE